MYACEKGHTETARMLLVEFHDKINVSKCVMIGLFCAIVISDFMYCIILVSIRAKVYVELNYMHLYLEFIYSFLSARMDRMRSFMHVCMGIHKQREC